MNETMHRVEDLQDRIAETAGFRQKAAERLARHHKLSLWTLSCLAMALICIPLIQTLAIRTGIDNAHLNAAQSLLAILALAFALLVGMEKFVAQTASAGRGALELERLQDKLAARDPQRVSDAEYAAFAKEYYDIVERYENHQPLDRLMTWLDDRPRKVAEWPRYAGLWIQAQLLKLCNYAHYLVTLGLVAFVFFMLLTGIGRHLPAQSQDALELRSSTVLENGGATTSRSPKRPQ